MIDIVHIQNRWGRQMCAVFQDRYDTPIMKEYMEAYYAGRHKPHHSLPAIRQHYEFGWNLNECCPVLMHVMYGVYEEPNAI